MNIEHGTPTRLGATPFCPRDLVHYHMTKTSQLISLSILRRLLSWYRANKRQLPWRGLRDPYGIWVSEIMLQQTRVETVIPYFKRWMRRFPTMRSLANASLDEVLKVWEGCGYYARARNLHRAARLVVRNKNGQLPSRADELKRLPGIGPYTAAAIASIAFGEPVPVLDGNVQRVLCRLLAERRTLQSASVQKRLRRASENIMGSLSPRIGAPGELNQALMELGATVCTVRHPQCSACPLKLPCRARAKFDDPSVLPLRKKSQPLPHHHVTAAIIGRRGRLLITQRKPDGFLGGLWEFPGGTQEKGESLEECLKREIREELGVDIEVSELFATVKHSYSHFRITLHAFVCALLRGRIRKLGVADYRWVSLQELHDFAFPKADRVIIQELLEKQNHP
jgi:A/G-specific adenine glycosylase